MDEALLNEARDLIERALAEDLGKQGDITTRAIAQHPAVCRAEIIAKAAGVVAGVEITKSVFTRLSPDITFSQQIPDGASVQSRQRLLLLVGPCEKLLIAERTALNFLGRLCGIATLTRQFVDAVHGTRARILDTRKTTPGWRALEKYAVRCGGGHNHRMGLYDMALIKDNHIIAAGGITPAVQRCRNYLQENQIKALIEVEAKNMAEVEEAVELQVDRILLDNMATAMLEQAVEWVAGRIPLEASGNVSLDNVRLVAETGVDYISIGALTHSARNLDVSLEFIEGG
ncbi:carboxylating nicotinate-nucleotide diphosphorylase [candidate division KSB1 bacterium]|nr:carboxylating nicotinate-nucleotide diphosphorylase [candidate division KSB1 bacterium]